MLTILGPAKTIDTKPHSITKQSSLPAYFDEAEYLVRQIRKLRHEQVKALMKVSDKLATLNADRFASWKRSQSLTESQHALLAFSGEVFNGLRARTFSEEDLLFAQSHVRILSGLYGILRPLDLIMPYRLEMGTRIADIIGQDLYRYWKEIIPPGIIKQTEQSDPKVLINLASNEYFRSIDPKNFPHRVITPVFKESDGDGFRNVTIYAKKARGMMLRFIICNRINDPEHLKAFDEEHYYFNQDLSTGTDWVFCR